MERNAPTLGCGGVLSYAIPQCLAVFLRMALQEDPVKRLQASTSCQADPTHYMIASAKGRCLLRSCCACDGPVVKPRIQHRMERGGGRVGQCLYNHNDFSYQGAPCPSELQAADKVCVPLCRNLDFGKCSTVAGNSNCQQQLSRNGYSFELSYNLKAPKTGCNLAFAFQS